MKKILELKQIFDITLAVIVIGTFVFFFAFGSCLWIARQEAKHEADAMMVRNIAYVQEHINGELNRVEDAAYTLISSTFGLLERTMDGKSHVAINPVAFRKPTSEELYEKLENFLRANPHLSGVAVAFEPYVYQSDNGPFGYAPYVIRSGDELRRYQIGELSDYRQYEWYSAPATTDTQYWSEPYRESSDEQRMVATFSIPLHGYADRLVGVLALDISVDDFAQRLREAAPYEGAELVLLTDSIDYYASLPFHYVFTNTHSQGTYMLVCPEVEVMGGVMRMQRQISIIGSIGLVVMIICFIFLFRHMQKINMAKTGMEKELKIASAIQKAMIPKQYPAFPERKELDVYGYLRPAKSVGGDLYDYFIREDKFYFVVGDVSGKGVPASLFMAVVRALFRNISLHTCDPAAIAGSLNTALSDGNDTNMFCTMFVGVLDLVNGHFEYCNAGHNAPVIRRRDEQGNPLVGYMTPEVNLALGVFPDFPYQREETILRPGEAILLYTDGVTEAENAEHNLFGEQALLDTLHHTREANLLSVKDFVEHTVIAIDEYANGAEQSDDITILAIEYKGH